MLTICLSVVLVCLGVTLGLGLPLVGLSFDYQSRRDAAHAREVLEQRSIIADYEATIDAYRHYARHDPALSKALR